MRVRAVQFPTARTHREFPAIDGEHSRSLKKLAKNNIKRFSHDRGKDEIRQNAEAPFWNGLISEFAHDVVIKVLDLISEGIRHLHAKKQTRVTYFMSYSLQFFPRFAKNANRGFRSLQFRFRLQIHVFHSQFDFEFGNSRGCRQDAEIRRWVLDRG
jgi:hypothetical protein